MNTELTTNTAYNNFVTVFKAIALMNQEFKEGLGVDYLFRLVARHRNLPLEDLYGRVLKAFEPTQNAFRREQEIAGGVTGIQKALYKAKTFNVHLSALGKLANSKTGTVWATPTQLCPDLLAYCASQRNRDNLAHHWIGVADTELDATEISEMILFLQQELLPKIDEINRMFQASV